jgi:uroporphyrinogen-III decarboxylase
MTAEMNAVERVLKTIAGQPVDRVPVVPLMIHHAVKQAGYRLGECAQACGQAGCHALTFGEATSGADGLEVDYQHDISFYRGKVGDQLCLKGNIEPSGVLYQGTPLQVREACRKAIVQSQACGRLILSSGCETPRDTPAENIHAMVASAKEFGSNE